MTGCGTVMWMAPEIMLGQSYNEKVDVYSFSMCLVELIDRNLPWHWCPGGAEVPFKVSRGERPDRQLSRVSSGLTSSGTRAAGGNNSSDSSVAKLGQLSELIRCAQMDSYSYSNTCMLDAGCWLCHHLVELAMYHPSS